MLWHLYRVTCCGTSTDSHAVDMLWHLYSIGKVLVNSKPCDEVVIGLVQSYERVLAYPKPCTRPLRTPHAGTSGYAVSLKGWHSTEGTHPHPQAHIASLPPHIRPPIWRQNALMHTAREVS